MPFIVLCIVGFFLCYIFIYSKSEDKRKNDHKKYMAMINKEKNSVEKASETNNNQ